jgi:hypothetical protein
VENAQSMTLEVLEDAIKKIQRIQRAKAEQAQDMVAKKSCAGPVKSEEFHGATTWEIVLSKHDNKTKYGFWYENAKVELLKGYSKAFQQEENAPVDLTLLSSQERPEALIVTRISKRGLLDEWNTSHPEAKVKIGDHVVKVNNSETIMDMQKELKSPSCICKILRFPKTFHIQVEKQGNTSSWGFKYASMANSQLLSVAEISQDGLLDRVNRANMRRGCHHLVVLPGMSIDAVNTIENDGTKMAAELTSGQAVQLRIKRNGVGNVAKPVR